MWSSMTVESRIADRVAPETNSTPYTVTRLSLQRIVAGVAMKLLVVCKRSDTSGKV